MPDPRKQKDDHQVDHPPHPPSAAAAQRDEHEIAEPVAQRDMPPPRPELGHCDGQIGAVKVARQAQTDKGGQADGHVAIARKVAIDLERKGIDGKDQVNRRGKGGLVEPRRHDGGKTVGNHHLLDQPGDEIGQTEGRKAGPQPDLRELRDQGSRPLDRSGRKLGKPHQMQDEIAPASRRALSPALLDDRGDGGEDDEGQPRRCLGVGQPRQFEEPRPDQTQDEGGNPKAPPMGGPRLCRMGGHQGDGTGTRQPDKPHRVGRAIDAKAGKDQPRLPRPHRQDRHARQNKGEGQPEKEVRLRHDLRQT